MLKSKKVAVRSNFKVETAGLREEDRRTHNRGRDTKSGMRPESSFSDRELDSAFLIGRIGVGHQGPFFCDNALHSAEGYTRG